jgi:transcriptional regulator with XRE-family HTH domain
MNDAAHLILAAREALGWQRADLARASGVSVPTLTRIERGEAKPRHHTLVAISEALERAGVIFDLPEPGVAAAVKVRLSEPLAPGE